MDILCIFRRVVKVLPTGGFCPNLLEIRFCRWILPTGGFARTCSKLGSVESLFYPSNGWFCQNLPEIRSAKSLFDPSDGWFCPNLPEIRSAKSPFDPSDGWFCPNLLEIRSAKSHLILISSQPRIRAFAEPVVRAVREARGAASSFRKSPRQSNVNIEYIRLDDFWVGKGACALEWPRKPLSGAVDEADPACAAGLGKARRRSELSMNGDYG